MTKKIHPTPGAENPRDRNTRNGYMFLYENLPEPLLPNLVTVFQKQEKMHFNHAIRVKFWAETVASASLVSGTSFAAETTLGAAFGLAPERWDVGRSGLQGKMMDQQIWVQIWVAMYWSPFSDVICLFHGRDVYPTLANSHTGFASCFSMLMSTESTAQFYHSTTISNRKLPDQKQ